MKRATKLMCIVLGAVLWGGAASANLVGFYELDNNYLDLSGNGYDGTIVNNTDGTPSEVYPGTDRTGAANSAMWWPALNGIPHAGADYIDLGATSDRPLYQITGSMTVAAWVYLNPDVGGIPWSTTYYQSTILTKLGGSGNRAWMFAVENMVSGTTDSTPYSLRFRVSPNGSTLSSAYDTAELPLNQWVHVAAVYDAPAASIELYVNGVPRTTGTTGTIPTSQYAGSSSIKIGNRDALVQQWWKGGLDEIRIYDNALTPEEIIAIIPEPGALALLGLGLGFVAVFRRKR